MYVICMDQYVVVTERVSALELGMKHSVWPSASVPVTDVMTDQNGNVHEVVPGLLSDVFLPESTVQVIGVIQSLVMS